jgi:hypothetical protein
MKPLELKDFSGGQTDFFFRGEATRSQILYNLLVGIDHSLDSRPGTLVKNNAEKAERINYIQSFNSLTDLLYASEGHFYDIDGTEILGPSGNIAFVGATPEAMYTSSELPQHLIVACDEELQPQKFFKDSLGALQVRTVGLPEVVRPEISDADLLTECIAAANLLRTRFLAHINSSENLNSERDGVSANYLSATLQPPSSTNAHWSVDKYALSYFQAVVFGPGQWQPITIPTPAPAATDYATLVTLIEALQLAFEEHREDSAGFAAIDDPSATNINFGPNRYHALGYQSPFTDFTNNFGYANLVNINNLLRPMNQGIQQRISLSSNPDNAINASIPENEVYRTKLEAVALFLDDYAVKFALHEAAPFVHRYNSQNSLGVPMVADAFSHQFLAPLLGTNPVIIPTPFNFIYCANYTQRAFENHAMNTDGNGVISATFPSMHTLANDTIVSGLPAAGQFFATLPANPTVREQYTAFYWDVVLAKLNIFTARYAYYIHSLDLLSGAQTSLIDQTASGGAGPGTWTAHYLTNPGGVNYTAGNPGECVIAAFGFRASNQAGKKLSFNGITSNDGAGNYHLAFDATTLLTVGLSTGTFVMHPYPLMSGNPTFPNYDQTAQYLKSFGYAPDIYDLAGWVDIMKSFYDAFKVHISTTDTHYLLGTASIEFSPAPESGYPQGGVQYFPLSSLLPSVDLPNTTPKFFLPEVKSYGYAFTYSDTYTVENDVTYRVESAPVFSEAINSEETLAVGVTALMYGETTVYQTNEIITSVAMILDANPLTNDAESNYATTLLNTYRTTGDGTTYFKINLLAATVLDLTPIGGGIINLLGSYDLVSDQYSINGNVALNDSQDTLYTNGGVSASNQPPKSKYTWIANDFVYYAGVYDGTTFLPNRVLQSVQLAPDWVPSQNFVDFASPVVGGGSARNVNVCLTETGVFRLEGSFGKDGSGSIVKQQISNQIGGISGSSIVVTEIGLFFAGTNGFYYTDGYQCIRLSQELVRTYKSATELASQKRAIKGVYDRENRRVLWTMRSNSFQTDNDIILAYDLNFGVTPSGVFTTLFGASGSWNPSALGYLANVLYLGDTDGYLYFSDEATKTDPLKNILTAPNTWETTYLPWEWRSTMMDFGGTAMRKFFSRIHHVGKNRGDVAIQYYITADNFVTQDLAPMRFIDNGGLGAVDQWRRVGGKKLRADLYQVGCRNGRFTVYNSDAYGGTPVFVSHVGVQTTITMVASLIPLDSVGMSLCFASDYYATEYVIESVAHVGPDTTLVLTDPTNAVNGLLTLQWEIRGFMKDQAFSLDALTIWFEEQGNLGSQYRGYSSEQGGGGNV